MIQSEGIALESINQFMSGFTLPKAHSALSPTFLQQRCRDADDGSLKVFASELFYVLPLLQ